MVTASIAYQDRWRESEKQVKTFERQRRMSIQKAKKMESEKVDIFEQMPYEKKETFVRRMSEKRQRYDRPARYI